MLGSQVLISTVSQESPSQRCSVPRRRAAAVNRQAGDLEPEEVLQAFDTLAVQVVHIAHANVATGQARRCRCLPSLARQCRCCRGAVVGGVMSSPKVAV